MTVVIREHKLQKFVDEDLTSSLKFLTQADRAFGKVNQDFFD